MIRDANNADATHPFGEAVTNVEDGDHFDWTRHDGCTPSADTGPCKDHTSKDGMGKYLYIESSYPRLPGHIARITRQPANQYNCFKLWYHMSGADIGWLSVYRRSGTDQETLLWSMNKDQGEEWKQVHINLRDSGNNNLRQVITIEGGIGNGYHGDIAIDDLTLERESCSNVGLGFPLKQVAHYRLDGRENDIMLEGNTSFKLQQGWTAVYLDGVTSLVRFSNEFFMSEMSFTVALWVLTQKPDENSILFSSFDLFEIKLRNTAVVTEMMSKLSCCLFHITGRSLKANTWTHVAVTWNLEQRTACLWVDNESETVQVDHAVDLPINAPQNFSIGSDSESGNLSRYQGYVRDVKLFEKPLSPAEVEEIKGPECKPACQAPGFCDREMGKCFCGDLDFIIESCENALVATIYNESISYVPFDESNFLDLKTGNRLSLVHPPDRYNATTDHVYNVSLIVGPVNRAIQLSREAHLKLLETSCFDRPSLCQSGMSVVFWIKLFGPKFSPSFFLTPLPTTESVTVEYFRHHEGVAFRAHVDDELLAGIEVLISWQTHFCSYGFSVPKNAWSHVTMVWMHKETIRILLNGRRLPANTNCSETSTPLEFEIANKIRIGSHKFSLSIDEFAVWNKALSLVEAKSIFSYIHTVKPKEVFLELKFLNEVWQERLKDPESVTYNLFITKLTGEFLSLFSEISNLTALKVHNFSAGSVIAELTLSFYRLSYDVILLLEEALFTNKSLGNMAIKCESIRFLSVPDVNVRIINAHAPNSTSVSVTWSRLPEEDFQGAFQGYKTLYKTTNDGSAYKAFTTYGALTSALIKDLRPGTQYTLIVFPFNVYGDGRHSQPVNVTTQEQHLKVTGHNISSNEIEVFWNSVSLDFLGFVVKYWPRTDGEVTAIVKHVLRTENSIQLGDLKTFTVYVIQVEVVRVSNNTGRIRGQANISTDEGAPSRPPGNVTAFANGTGVIRVTWIPVEPEFVHGVLRGYKVRFKGYARISALDWITESVGSGTNYIELSGLKPQTTYEVQVSAFTIGDGNYSESVIVITQKGPPSRPPGNVTAFANGTGVIRVTWIPVEPEFVHGVLRGYKVRFKGYARISALDWITESVGSGTNYIELSGLKPQTTYEVQVSAFTIGDGNYSESVIVITQKGPLSHPQNVTAQSTSPTTITVNWNQVIVEAVNVSLFYIVRWTENRNGVEKNATASSTSYVITDLRIATEYNVCVATFYDGVITEFSREVLVRTQDLQDQHFNISGHNVSAEAIKVYWNPLSVDVNNYSIKYWAEKESERTAVEMGVSKTTNNLKIKRLKPFTVYVVRVTTVIFGLMLSGQARISTDEAVPSQAPKITAAYNTSSTSVIIHWSPISENETNGDLVGYRVDCFLFWAVRAEQSVITSSNSTFIELHGLKKFKKYVLWVAGFTRKGVGVNDTVECTTDEDVPSSPPEHVFVRTTNHSDLQITWSRVPSSDAHSIVLGYHVQVTRENGEEIAIVTSPLRGNTSLSNLTLYQNYCVAVTAFSKKGKGPVSLKKCAVVNDEVPCPPPKHLLVRNVTATGASLKLVYDGACVNAGFVTGYRVTYTSDTDRSQLKIPDAESTSVFLQNLTPNTTYQVKIMVLTSNGKDSIFSEPVQLITNDSIHCQPPQEPSVHDVTATSASIEWVYNGACVNDGFVTGYRVTYTSGASRLQLDIPDAGSTSAFLQNLTRLTTYLVEVMVLTSNGKHSVSSEPVQFITKEIESQERPENVQALLVLSDLISLKWSFTVNPNSSVLYQGFKVQYRVIGREGDWSVLTVHGIDKRSLVLSEMKPDLSYEVIVKASSGQSEGNPSHAVIITTPESVPSAPPVNVTSLGQTSTNRLFVQWMNIPDDEVNGELKGYVVSYVPDSIGGVKVIDGVAKTKSVGADTHSIDLDKVLSFTTYAIRVAGLTKRGEGKFCKVKYEETCRCKKRLTANYWSKPPYVISPSANSMSGIFMAFLDEMVFQCCANCSRGHGTSYVDYNSDGRRNVAKKPTERDMIAAIDHVTDLHFPVHGSSDQRKYLRTFKYVPVVESPGAAFIIRYEKPEALITKALVECWPLVVVVVVFVLSSGLLYWIMDWSQNSELPPSFLRGFWEGIWWAFVTCSTVGYGDRTPRSFLAKWLTMVWMITGSVVFSLLSSSLIAGLTVITVDNSHIKLYGLKVAALHDSPEYNLALKRNAQVNNARNYTNLEEIREDLLKGVVKGALIDTYVVAERYDLFQDKSLQIYKLINYRSSFGIVLGGNSVRLQPCFLDYLKNEKSMLSHLVKNYTATLQQAKTSLAEQMATGMFDSSEHTYKVNVIVLSAILAGAIICGVIFEFCRWMKDRNMRQVADEETRRHIIQRHEFIQETNKLTTEFFNNIYRQYNKLAARHREEQRQLLNSNRQENRSCWTKR
ncbi:uncharacterized protein LOC111336503 [Stylophora pistillata]|uniref:uncharacterized protein LOC111336503 n=1 Tax=Stylophora pistillata TaxID=50429 RepID=UPI000C043A6D|nr:uncharacterized protein LOC111336503 [Stylophora pistillata]